MNIMQAGLSKTNFDLPGQINRYQGKVRDVYYLESNRLVIVATDRISAFDVILPKCIPGKGKILNEVAALMLDACRDIVPNWLTEVPVAGVSIGYACEPIKLEVVVRAYLAGHAARQYALGHRMLCGVSMPEGLIENAPFLIPVITPSTKASEGHDEDISFEEAIATGLITQNEAIQLQSIALRLFERGTKLAADRGLILVDTKYEFGRSVKGEVILIDEIHTPDSSRYFEASDYEERMKQGIRPRQLSKEFVREWLIAEGFQGKEGESIPEMTEKKVKEIQERYIELYQRLTGRVFVEPETSTYETMEEKVIAALNRMTNNS